MCNIGTRITAVLSIALLSFTLGACKEKGPVEQVGEEVDEAIDTARNGGKESTANKLDDAADELREGVNDAADEVKSK